MGTAIIIGMGEVGRALQQVLSTGEDPHHVITYDAKQGPNLPNWNLDTAPIVLHVCIPYSSDFADAILRYQYHYQPDYTIVHSTVPVGTCKALDVHHSPVRGIHPYLAESMRIFETYLAPRSTELKAYLEQVGMRVKCVADTDATEAGKLWSLASYGVSILLEKEIHRWCQKHDTDFNVVYKQFTHSYNDGYAELGMVDYARPVLEHMEGQIGGHCVVPGMEKLAGGSKFIRSMLWFNENG